MRALMFSLNEEALVPSNNLNNLIKENWDIMKKLSVFAHPRKRDQKEHLKEVETRLMNLKQ
jgi:hypothetical protein